MANKYIILRNSTEQADWEALDEEQQALPENFKGHKFHVTMNDYAPALILEREDRKTLGGVIDVSVGPIYYQWRGVLRCRHELDPAEADQNWGTFQELQAYYQLNNPNGEPTNLITLVDHFGAEHKGYILSKEFGPRTITPYVDGYHAIYFIPLMFSEKEAVA